MKRLNIISALLAGLFCLTACNDDRDSNPVIQQPDTFVLNMPAYSSNVYDLENTGSIEFTCKQPDYGYTAPVNYEMQIALDDQFTEDNYIKLDPVTTAKFSISGLAIDKAFMRLIGCDAEESFDKVVGSDPHSIVIRLRAYVGDNMYECYSNHITLQVLPYFVLVKDATPAVWFFVGPGAAGCAWDNKANYEDVGEGLIPMALQSGYTYDAETGDGEFVYTGPFYADGFKLIQTPGQWSPMWGSTDGGLTDGAGQYRPLGSNDDPATFASDVDGWLQVIMFTSNKGQTATFKFAKIDQPSNKVYDHMQLTGSFEAGGGWGSDPLYMTVNAGNPHIWWADYTFDSDAEAKFRNGDDWFGGDFPISLTGSSNIQIPAGKYRIVFNDLDGCIYFFTKD